MRQFGEPTKKYIVAEDTLVHLLMLEHINNCGDADPFEYFWDVMVESGCQQHVSHREFVEAVKNMTFESMAEFDLGLFEEYEEK